MRNATRIVLLLVVAGFGGHRLELALRSPEDWIRSRLEDAQDGFNASRLSPCMALLAPEFVDETSGFQREDLKAVLVHVFFDEIDPATKAFRFRVAFDDVRIAVQEQTAEVTFTVRLAERDGEAWREAWTFRLDGEFFDGAGGWALERARFRTLGGDLPE